MKTVQYQINDKVKLSGCPFDDQIPEEMVLFNRLQHKTLVVTELLTKPNGQLIRTNMTDEWIHAGWFCRC